jgi:hypothetical protein
VLNVCASHERFRAHHDEGFDARCCRAQDGRISAPEHAGECCRDEACDSCDARLVKLRTTCGACGRRILDEGTELPNGVVCARASNCIGSRDGQEAERAAQRELRAAAQRARAEGDDAAERAARDQEAQDEQGTARDFAAHCRTCSYCGPKQGLIPRAQVRIGCQRAREARRAMGKEARS